MWSRLYIYPYTQIDRTYKHSHLHLCFKTNKNLKRILWRLHNFSSMTHNQLPGRRNDPKAFLKSKRTVHELLDTRRPFGSSRARPRTPSAVTFRPHPSDMDPGVGTSPVTRRPLPRRPRLPRSTYGWIRILFGG